MTKFIGAVINQLNKSQNRFSRSYLTAQSRNSPRIYFAMKLILVLLVVLLSWSETAVAMAEQNASYFRTTEGYEIVLKDVQRLMAHDISGLFHNKYVIECHILTKSMTGEIGIKDLEIFEVRIIDSKSERREPYNILGHITIDGTTLTVDIQDSAWADPMKDHRPYLFNGSYKLARKFRR